MALIGAVRLWLAVKPVRRIRNLRERRRKRKGLPPLETTEEQDVQAIIGAFKSKTIWVAIVVEAWGLVQVFLEGGVFTRESVSALVLGILMIVLRSITNTSLSAK